MGARLTSGRVQEVVALLAQLFDVPPSRFMVHAPGHHGPGWTISSEGQQGVPYGWTIRVWPEVMDRMPDVFAEPDNGNILSVSLRSLE